MVRDNTSIKNYNRTRIRQQLFRTSRLLDANIETSCTGKEFNPGAFECDHVGRCVSDVF